MFNIQTVNWSSNDEEVEIVNQFNNLGLTISYTGIFLKSQILLAFQGRKCMFKLLKSMQNVYFNYVTGLSLFNTYVHIGSVLKNGDFIKVMM